MIFILLIGKLEETYTLILYKINTEQKDEKRLVNWPCKTFDMFLTEKHRW